MYKLHDWVLNTNYLQQKPWKMCMSNLLVQVKSKNALNFLRIFSHQWGLKFEPWAPCMQPLALTISATETRLTVSLNQRHLLIVKAQRATSNVGWRSHFFVNSILSVTIVAMYIKSRWLHFYLTNITTNYFWLSVSSFIVDIPPLSPDGTHYLDVSQSRVRWNEQLKTA